MGGIIILAAVIVTSLFYVKDYPKIIPVLFLTVAFGLIGFLDDYLKVVLKRSDGLMPMQKMALQIIVTAVFCILSRESGGYSAYDACAVSLTDIILISAGWQFRFCLWQ